MRATVLILATLCLFATAQVAMAFDMCCSGNDHSVTDTHDGHNHKTPSKNDKPSSHCPMSAHHSLAVLKDHSFTQPVITAAKSVFSQPSFHELSISERLIEPPARA